MNLDPKQKKIEEKYLNETLAVIKALIEKR